MPRVLRVLPLVASLLLVTAASAQTTDPGIEKLRTDYEQAWKKADAKAIAALYAEEGVWVNQAGIVTRGRPALEKVMAENFLGDFKGSTIAITSGVSQVIAPDIAVAEGTYTISGATGPDGKPLTVKGHYLNTLVKKGASWVIASSAAFVPQPAAGAAKPGKGKTQ
jgi:uncharacterized protein (TIGR02246 family)